MNLQTESKARGDERNESHCPWAVTPVKKCHYTLVIASGAVLTNSVYPGGFLFVCDSGGSPSTLGITGYWSAMKDRAEFVSKSQTPVNMME